MIPYLFLGSACNNYDELGICAIIYLMFAFPTGL